MRNLDVKIKDIPPEEIFNKPIFRKIKKCNQYGHIRQKGSINCKRCGMTYTDKSGYIPQSSFVDYTKLHRQFDI